MNWGRALSFSLLLHSSLIVSAFLFFSFHAPKMKFDTRVGVHEIQVVSNAKPEENISAPTGPVPSRVQDAGRSAPSDRISDAAGGLETPGVDTDYLSTIMQMILSHQNYPKVSVLNEEEGVVQVQVVLDGQGKIESLSVDQTSGFGRLDEAALSTLRSIGQLPLPPNSKGSVSLMIPIRFEINTSKHSFHR